MDQETKELLRKNIALSQENNEILRSMRRNARVNSFFRAIYWIVIIVATYYGYLYLQPYLAQLQATYKTVQNAQNSVSASVPNFSNLLKQYQGGTKQ